jgi:hypothetical protein
MTDQQKNRIKALFLLMVFSMNTIAGFACSIGIDMGYNSHHHSHEKAYRHVANKGDHTHKDSHKHSPIAQFKSGDSDDCCSNDVAKFALLDKSVVNNNLHLQAPIFPLAFSTTFLPQTINENGLAVNSKFQFVRRSSFPNDTDIQTAIRRFQI